MVLDCIASGCAWIDMQATGVDVLMLCPAKGLERLSLRGSGDDVRARAAARLGRNPIGQLCART